MNVETQFVDWVSPAQLITQSESSNRNLQRVVVGGVILKGLFDWANKEAETHTAKKQSIPDDSSYSVEQLREKRRDEVRTKPLPPPPNVSGKLFEPNELDIYCKKDGSTSYIFHGKHINYSEISHLEYHSEDNWVVVILKDGTRKDLGVHIQWLLRPYWRKSEIVNIVRTKDGESQEGAYFGMYTISGKTNGRNYRAGFMGANLKGDDGSSQGFVVREIYRDTAAEESDLKVGDEIVRVNGRAVSGIIPFVELVRNGGGRTMHLQGYRGGKAIEITLTPRLPN